MRGGGEAEKSMEMAGCAANEERLRGTTGEERPARNDRLLALFIRFRARSFKHRAPLFTSPFKFWASGVCVLSVCVLRVCA